MTTRQLKAQQPEALKYAIYCRYSDEVQNDLSLESQEMMCREEIARRGGIVIAVYKDAARFGWSLDREDFNRLRADAERGCFDATMMWKFDRLARSYAGNDYQSAPTARIQGSPILRGRLQRG